MDWTDEEFNKGNRAIFPKEGQRNHPTVKWDPYYPQDKYAQATRT